MHLIPRAQRVSSVLLLALLCVASACDNSPVSQLSRQDGYYQASHCGTGSTNEEQGSIVGAGDELEVPIDTIVSMESVANSETTVNHQNHRHETKSGLLGARGVYMNGSTATTSNPTALSCYATYSKWRAGSMSWAMTAIDAKTWSTTTTVSTITQTLDTVATIYPSGSLSTYKLCDGSPRVDFEPLTLTSTYTSVSEYDAYITPGLPTYSSSKPCNASSDDCEYLYYHSGLSWDDLTLLGLCGAPAHLGLPCLIMGGPVELAYFPVTTVGNDKCGANGSTITNTGGPTAIEALGTTLTSGSVYLSFQTLYAFQEGFGRRIGPAFTDFILPLPSSAISTQCGGWFSAQGPGTPLNYADLNYPWPASAYNCMNRCRTDLSFTIVNGTGVSWSPPPQCSTIWSDLNPILAMPTEVRNLVPAWSTCSMWDAALPNFVFDPPRALIAGTAVATPTPAWEHQGSTTPASPAATSYTALPETMASTSTTSTTTTSVISSSTSPSSIPHAVATPTRGTGVTGISIEFSVDGHAFTATAGDNAFSISGQTISVGGPPQVVEDETISLALSGFVVNATMTIPFNSRFAPTTTPSTSTSVPTTISDAGVSSEQSGTAHKGSSSSGESHTARKGSSSSGGSTSVVSAAWVLLMSLLAVVWS